MDLFVLLYSYLSRDGSCGMKIAAFWHVTLCGVLEVARPHGMTSQNAAVLIVATL